MTPLMDPSESDVINVPGTSLRARLMLPARFVCTLLLWSVLYPLTLVVAILRALYLRCVVGKPSQILKKGCYNRRNVKDLHYVNMHTFSEPLDEKKLYDALVSLCSEDGIKEAEIEVKFFDEKPNDWPATGSFPSDHFIESLKMPGAPGVHNFILHDSNKAKWDPPGKPMMVRYHVWNNDPGKPTIAYYSGSMMGWDGSANFNFTKELMNRYVGNPPNKVFQHPDLKAESVEKFDQGSFLVFLLKMPFNVARNWWMLLWNVMLAAKIFGGNGLVPVMTVMNFTEEDSTRLYKGAKAQGLSPYAAMAYATVKACEEVLGERPRGLTQQASLQTRHYPLENQEAGYRDLVGDWLVGVIQPVNKKYGPQEAMAGYKDLMTELDTIGPATTEAIMAKAYGVVNSGAGVFECPPMYNVWNSPFNKNVFFNNYGSRKMPEGSPFHWWNWNAPFYCGINTINVDGRTTTMFGSMFWGLKVVEKLRDHAERTLREEFMAKASEVDV